MGDVMESVGLGLLLVCCYGAVILILVMCDVNLAIHTVNRKGCSGGHTPSRDIDILMQY